MITVFWGARHGQGVTTTLVLTALALIAAGQKVRVVDADPDSADIALFHQQDASSQIDSLLEDAERQDVKWPAWTPWYSGTPALLGNPKRQFPATASAEAAQRFVAALKAVDEADVHILCDIGSGQRDYLTVAMLSAAERVAVVSGTDLPDGVATQAALRYIAPRLAAQDKVLVLVGQGSATAEILRDAGDWRAVKVQKTPQAARMRVNGQVTPQKGSEFLAVVMSDGAAAGKGRGGWRSRKVG